MITFPAFASSWLGTPSLPPSNAGGLSMLAYSGGGGSAKTGVFNLIHVSSAHQLSEEEREDDANATPRMDAIKTPRTMSTPHGITRYRSEKIRMDRCA